MRRLANLFRFGRHSHPSFHLERRWPEQLEIRVAQSEQDLEKAFGLLHDSYVREGLASEQPSHLRILPQQLLPQSSVLVASWEGRIVAAVSIIRDNPLGLPVEERTSLHEHRSGGKYLAEMSIFAYDPMDQELINRIQFALFRYVYQYSAQTFGVQKLVLVSGKSNVSFFTDFFCFDALSRKSQVLLLDLETAPRVWENAYQSEPDEKNLAQYLSTHINHPGCKLPSRVHHVATELIMTPQMLERLYLKKARLSTTLKSEEVRALRDAYPHENFESLLKHISWSEDKAPKRELRLDMQMSARIVESDRQRPAKVNVRNISRHGLQLWSEGSLTVDEILTLEVRLDENQYTRIRAQVKWADSSGFSGLRILAYSAEWGQMIQTIEGQLAKLAAST